MRTYILEEGRQLVSIIVRTKDRPKLLKKALQSIAAQTYRPLEVVLVNDGGCDLDIEELRTILGEVSLNYISLEKNTGRARAGKFGIENAKGEYVGFLDDDDELLPDHLTTLVAFLRQHDYKVAYTDALLVHKIYDPATLEIKDIKKEAAFSQDFDYDRLIFENYIPLMCLLFEGKALKATNGFDPSFDLYEDWDLLLQVGERTPFYHLKKETAYYNQWSAGLQIAQANKNHLMLRMSYLKIVSKHIAKVTPERIHDYMVGYVGARQALNTSKAESDLLSANLREQSRYTAELKAEIEKKAEKEAEDDSTISMLKKELDDVRREMHSRVLALQGEIKERDDLITAVKNTIGWKVLERYRKIRNRLFRSTSRGTDSLALKGLGVLKNQGFKAFIRKANKKFLFNKTIKQSPKTIRLTSSAVNTVGAVDSISPIQSRVSVVIPTRNAGEEFDYILRRITQQEFVNDIEVVIVDSGSQDRTLEVCREYTENILQIPHQEFHHGKTRNLGAERASGEFLVFTAQDAVPIGNNWLYKLLLPICEGQASAVSACQIPRADSDLFSCWSYWSHNLGYLGNDCDHICNNSLFKNFDDLDIQSKRTMASLDTVCLGIRKSTFTSYKFQADYAEDLDLGIRLIKDGHSLLFQTSNAVIHSHTRPPMYFLKRGYTDTVSLWKLLSVRRDDLPTTSALEAASYVYARLKGGMTALAERQVNVYSEEGLRALNDILGKKMDHFDPAWRKIMGDGLVDGYFMRIEPMFYPNIVPELSGDLIRMIESFSLFIRSFALTGGIEKDFRESIFKIFCVAAGNYFGAHTSGQIDSLSGGV